MTGVEWDPAWGKPGEIFDALAEGRVGDLTDVQRQALRLVQDKHRQRAEVNVRLSDELGAAKKEAVGAQRALSVGIAAEQARRVHDLAELQAAHATQLAELRRQVARLRRMPEGDTRCGKAPLRSEAEGRRLIALVCSETGEAVEEYHVYPCATCPPLGRHTLLPPLHIGHRLSRAERGVA